MAVPTVEDVLARCRTTNGHCVWDDDGGRVDLPEAELRQALQDAYDPLMPYWPALVELTD